MFDNPARRELDVGSGDEAPIQGNARVKIKFRIAVQLLIVRGSDAVIGRHPAA